MLLTGGWEFDHAYRYQIIHKPDQNLIHVKLWEESSLLLDTGDVIDSSNATLKGGRIGVFCMSQEDITWSALTYRSVETSNKLLQQSMTNVNLYSDVGKRKVEKMITENWIF